MQNDMSMMISGSKSKPEVELQHDGGSFSQSGSSNRYLNEIWCANRFRRSQKTAVPKPAAGSRFASLWPISWKIDITS